MASTGASDSNQLDQSVSSAAPAAKGKGGRPPHPIRQQFDDVGGSNNSSKRAGAQCKHCSTHFSAGQATVNELIKHIVSDCTKCPPNIKDQYQLIAAANQASSTSGEAASKAGVKRKAAQLSSPRQTSLDDTLATKAYQISKQQKVEVDFHILRWAVCRNIPFDALNDVHFHAALV